MAHQADPANSSSANLVANTSRVNFNDNYNDDDDNTNMPNENTNNTKGVTDKVGKNEDGGDANNAKSKSNPLSEWLLGKRIIIIFLYECSFFQSKYRLFE